MPIWSPAMIFGSAASGYVVENSIYLDGSADYLDKDFFVAGTEETWACSFWLKGFSINTTQYIFASRIDGNNTGYIEILSGSGNQLQMRDYDDGVGEPAYQVKTSAVLRDPTAWYHFLCVMNSSNSTSTDRQRIYINGVRQEASSPTYSSQDYASAVGINSANRHYIGQDGNNANDLYGYMAEFVFVDGSTTTTTVDSDGKLTNNELGEFDDNGVWVPKNPSKTIDDFGTNGIYLKFDDTNLLGKSSNSTTNPTSSFLGSQTFGSAATAFTVTGATLGDAASNRTIVIAVGGGRSTAGTRTVNTLTVGGSSATFIARKNSGAGNVLEFWSIDVSSGTSANIVATFSAAMATVGIAWWRVLDAGPPISTDGNTASGWTTQSVTTIGQTGDIAFYAIFDEGDADAYAWSDATERSEAIDITSTRSFTSADYTFTSAESHTETATISGGSGNDNAFVGVTFSNNNSFVANSLAAANQVTDTCTDSADDDIGNYCTWNPICAFPSAKVSLSNGNTQAVITADGAILGNQFFDVTDSDGFYWETKVTANIGNATHAGIGQQTVPLNNTSYLNNGIATYLNDGAALHTSSDRYASGTFPTWTNNDVIGVAVKGGAIWFSKNNTWINSATASEIAAGTTTNAVFTGLTGMWTPMVREHNGTNTTSTTNWGATSFAYTPPTGLKRLMTADRSAPTVTNSGNFFNTVLYTGNGSSRTISGVGFQPDWVWIKDRNVGENHYSFDAVRGAEKRVHQNTTDAEGTESTALTGFASDGFTLGDGSAGANTNTRTYVAWCWKAGGSGSSNSDGDIASTVSVASHGGFSIVKYDPGSGGSPGDTVGHGLSRAPNYIILKVLEAVGDANWSVGSDDIGWTNNLFLNLTNAKSAGSGPWNNTAPTSSVFSIGSDRDNDAAYIAYCFAKTPGLIACGTYTGNGSADGPFVQVNDGGSGFKPSFIMIKRTDSTEGWHINDAARDPFNPLDLQLQPNSSGTESGSSYMDFTANGFKLRGTQGATNTSGGTYVYLAMAENPFGGSGVAQAKAR